MATEIHPTAIVDQAAKIGEDVKIGPFCIVGPEAVIGDGTELMPHAQIIGMTTVGKNNKISAGAVLGGDPQDVGYKNEPTRVVVGDNNIIREFATINRGTTKQNGVTIVGSNNLIMAYVHIAHDCVIGNNCAFANLTQFAGHVHCGSYVFTSASAKIHQFCSIGDRCFIAPNAMLNNDAIPGIMYFGHPAVPRGLNLVNLKRAGFSPDELKGIKKAYKILLRNNDTLKAGLEELEASDITGIEFVANMIASVKKSLSCTKSRSSLEYE